MSLNHQHFGIFIGLSLAMHAVVLTAVLPDNTSIMNGHNHDTLDIELVTKQNTAQAVQPRRDDSHKTQARKNAASAISPVAVPNQHVMNTTAVETSIALPIANQDVSNSAAESIVSNTISIELLRYFYYPDAAIRRNWQGDVILQFTLLPDGHLDHIRIYQSSGYKALDDAALRALQQVTPQQELALLTDASMLHILPVSYRLTNPL